MMDSSHARTVNGQMDWECGHCGMLNFARVVCCGKCKAHVDHTTKYVSNRLREIKYERFARYAAQDGELAGKAPNLPPLGSGMRADGSSSMPSSSSRASFQH